MKKEDLIRGLAKLHHKSDVSTSNAGSKVLPISEATTPSSSTSSVVDKSGSSEKEKMPKGDKAKAIAGMKGLVKRAVAAAMYEKGGKHINWKVLHFRNRGKLKGVPDDEELSMDSPKISLRWEVESCSTTTSSVYSAYSMASSSKNDHSSANVIQDTCFKCPKMANWITTDAEFVVLEL